MVVGYCVQILAAATFWMLPESPRLLAELNRFDECKKNLEIIARWNKAKLNFDPKMLQPASANSNCALVLSGFPEGFTSTQVTAHLAQNVVQTPKSVKGTTTGFFQVEFENEEQLEDA